MNMSILNILTLFFGYMQNTFINKTMYYFFSYVLPYWDIGTYFLKRKKTISPILIFYAKVNSIKSFFVEKQIRVVLKSDIFFDTLVNKTCLMKTLMADPRKRRSLI